MQDGLKALQAKLGVGQAGPSPFGQAEPQPVARPESQSLPAGIRQLRVRRQNPQPVERTFSDRVGKLVGDFYRDAPIIGAALGADDQRRLAQAAIAVQNGNATLEQERELFDGLNELQTETTFGYKFADAVIGSMTFMAELGMTGGAAKIGAAGARKGAEKVVGKLVMEAVEGGVERVAAGQLAKRGILAAAGGLGATAGYLSAQTAAASGVSLLTGGPAGGRVTAATYQRMLSNAGIQLSEDEAGRVHVAFGHTIGDFWDTLPQGIADQAIEIGSEMTGGAIGKLPLVNKVSALQAAIMSKWLKKFPGKTVANFLEKLGKAGRWDGFIQELGEERVGAIARALTPGMSEEWSDVIPTAEDFLVEAASIATIGGAGLAAQAVGSTIDQKLTKDAATLPVAEEVAQQPGSATETVPDGAENAGRQGTGVAEEVAQLDTATIPDVAAPMGRAEGKKPQRVVHAAEIRGSLRRKRFETASKLLERFGVRAVPVQAEGGGSLAQPAMASPGGVVFFDVNAPVGERRDRGQGEFQGRAYHEAIHELAGFDAETYQGLQAAIESAVSPEIRASVLEDYRKRLGQEIPESIRDEEMVANLTEGLAPLLVLADKSHGPALLERIARNDFGLFQKILDALKKLSNRVAGTEFKTAAEQALRAWAGVDAKNITPAEAANAALLVNQALQTLTGRQAPSLAANPNTANLTQTGAEAPSESSQSLDEGAAEAPATPIGKPLPGRAADLPSTFTATQEAKTKRKLQRAERAARRLREQAERAAPEEAAKLRARAVYQDQRAKDYRDQLGTDADLKVGEQAREVQDEAARRRPFEKEMAPRRKQETRTERAKRIAEEGEERPERFAARAAERRERGLPDPSKVSFVATGDQLGDQYDETLWAYYRDADEKPVELGRIDYTLWQGELRVKMVEVPDSYRRMGYATALYDEAQRRNPNFKLQESMTTPDGTAFRRAYDREEGPSKFAAAYHAGPHLFDRFDMSKVGTGEGVQAFGHGLYYASRKGIAEEYKRRLARRVYHEHPWWSIGTGLGRKEVKPENAQQEKAWQRIAEARKTYEDFGQAQRLAIRASESAVKEAFNDLQNYSTPRTLQGYRDKYAFAKGVLEYVKKDNGAKRSLSRKGYGYVVELAPAEDEYLLWDKPLSEQSEKVKAAIERHTGRPLDQGNPSASGEGFYRAVSRDFEDLENADRAASEALLAAGIRGIKYLDGTSRAKGEGSYNYVLFSDQDVEIVDRFAAKGTPKVGAKRVFAGFDVADETKRDAIRRKIQDEFLRIKRIEEAARKQGADIPFEKSAYEAASSAQSRTRGATSTFERRHVAPLIRTLQALVTGGVSMEQAERYLYARHAPSRNREIARRREQARLDSATSDMRRILSDAASDGISPDLVSEHARNSRKTTKKAADRNAEIEAQAERPQRLKNLSEKYALASKGKAQESVRYAEASPSEQAAMVAELARANEGDGSGMATSEANRVVAAAESSEQAALYKKLGEQMDRMIQASLKERLDGGLISQDYYDQLESQWDHYVPLKSDVEGGAFGRGSGFQIRGKEFKRAEGRGSEAESIIAHAIQQGVEGISRAERNRVGLAFLRMLRDNPDVTNWSETRPAEPVDARLLSEREFSLKENGQQIIMEFEDPKTIRALKKMGQEQFGPILRVMRRAAGMWSQLNTTLSPDFVLTNLIRDLGTAGINLTSEQSAALAGMSLKNVPKAARGMYRYLTESEKGGEWAEAAELFAKEGGMVGWFYMPTIQEIQRKITGKLDEVDPTTGKRALMAATAAKDWIETLNQSLENGVRLASFKALVDSGTAPGKAASIARRLTVDFTRKGELSPVLNTLYIFSNASIQGTATMLRVLNTRRGKQFAVGLAGVGASLAYLGVMAGGDDEDGYSHYSKVPEWIRERNLVLMDPRGTGDYIKVPLPQGWNVFFGLGEKAAMASMGEMTTKDAAKGTFASAFEAFVPLGGEASLAQFASPTLLDPVVQQLENRTFFGGKIKPEQSQYGPTVPESELYFKSVSAASKGLAQWLNRISGGDEVQPGFLDVSPELIDHYAEFVGGSAGASLKRGLVDLPSKVLQGEAPAINEIPVVRRFLGESPEWWTSSTYYDHRNAIERLELRVENAREKGRPQEANALRRENRALWRLRGPMEAVDKQIRELRKRARTAPDKRREALERRIKALQMRFNKLAKESLDAVE